VWTSGATEANNALLHHASVDAQGAVWVSAIEHPSILETASTFFKGRLKLIPVSSQGILDLDWLAEHLRQARPALVAIMAANNETGVLQPWREALNLCRSVEVPFACDAAQWIGKLPAAGLGDCDFVTGCAHKFGGPIGVGFMKVPAKFKPFLLGGAQEDGRRAGTQNVPGTLSMMAAWARREQQIAIGESNVRLKWRDRFIERLRHELPSFEVLGANSPRLWNTVAALMPGMEDCRRRWVVRLDKAGFAVSTGSACSSGKEKPSHVVTAMQFDSTRSDRMLRFSAGWDTTRDDWDALADATIACCAAEKIAS
jgi:cysteine desulfurase